MSEFQFPWIESSIVTPIAGAAIVAWLPDSDMARRVALVFAAATFACAVGAWCEFDWNSALQSINSPFAARIFGRDLFVVDRLSAPLLPLTSILHFLVILVTSRTKIRRFSFTAALASDAISLATFSCQEPWGIIAGLCLGAVVPYWELVSRDRPTRGYLIHLAIFVGFMTAGWSAFESAVHAGRSGTWEFLLILIALCIRCGIVPCHGWIVGLFQHATFGMSILFVTPMMGIYGIVRLFIPFAPTGLISLLGALGLLTAIYAAGMALVQKELRRFYVYLFISHLSLIVIGLSTLTSTGVTGALCIWLSESVAMGGLGLTLRALESRRGRLSMHDFQGLYEHTPVLAMCFVLTGLAAVGFPGTFGFIGMEILVDGVVTANTMLGVMVITIGALNGIAIVQAFFLLFTGRHDPASVSLRIRTGERCGVVMLAALILLGGLHPQSRVASRHEASLQILKARDNDSRHTSGLDLEEMIVR